MTYGTVVTEVELNDDAARAQVINVGDVFNGVFHYYDFGSDGDWFKLTLPQAGIVTVTVSGHRDCKLQLSAQDFGIGWGIGSVTGENGKPVAISFSAGANKQGYIIVTPHAYSGVGADPGLIQCSKDGPFYVGHAYPPRQDKPAPSSYNGKPVLPALTYNLQVTLQPLPDQYEPSGYNDDYGGGRRTNYLERE